MALVYYEAEGGTTSFGLWYYDCAQIFTAMSTHPLASVKIRMKRVAVENPGNITLSIQETTDGKPNGNILASQVMPFNDVDDYTSQDYTFTFASPITLTKDVEYAIVVSNPATSELGYLYIVIYNLSGGTDFYVSTDGGSTWGLSTNRTMSFYNYGEALPPLVTTLDVTNVRATSCIGHGTIDDVVVRGYATKKGFCWNTSGTPTIADDKVQSIGSYSNGESIVKPVSGLLPDTTYYIRAYAYTVDGGYGYGDEVEFATAPAAPVVTTQAASVPDPIANSSYQYATGNGTIVSGADITERGFEVRIAKPSGVYDWIVHHIAGFVDDDDYIYMIKTENETGDFGTGAFSLILGRWPAVTSDTLFAGESYTYRAYCKVGEDAYYGSWVAFSLGNFPKGVMVDSLLPLLPVIDPSGGGWYPEDEIPLTVDDIPEIPDIPDYPPFEFPPFDFPEYVYPEERYTLVMMVYPPGKGVTSPPVGVHTGYEKDEEVDISVEITEGYEFNAWVGDVENSKSPVTTIIMDGNKIVVAFLIIVGVDEPISVPEVEPYEPVEYPEYPVPEPWEFIFPPQMPVPDVSPYVPPDLPGRYGMFYYAKAYTKKQMDELREKCIAYTTDNTEYCLTLRHNVLVLRQFFNMMSDNITDREEFNTFKDTLPTQHLNDLYHRRLELNDFRAIINDFISNAINNINIVNHNFDIINAGFEDYAASIDAGFIALMSRAKMINEDNPDVEMMKDVVDRLRRESKVNFNTIMTNLNVVKAIIT